jgi:hypothetical protein
LDFELPMRGSEAHSLKNRGRYGVLLAVGIAGSAAAFSGRAAAQVVDDGTRSTARDLASQAKAAYASGDYERARDLFHRAYTLIPAPTISLNEARALVKLHRLVDASEAYMRGVRTSLDAGSPEQFRTAARDSEVELVLLKPRIPKLTVVPSGPGAGDPDLVVTLDGKAMHRAVIGVETPVDPGKHRVTARAPGGDEASEEFTLEEKQKRRVEILVPAGRTLPPAEGTPAESRVESSPMSPSPAAPPPPPSPPAPPDRSVSSTQRILGFTAVGVGVAGVATGVITGLMAASKYSQAESGCPSRACVEGSPGDDALHSFRTLRTVSTVGYVVGGVGLAGGIALLLTLPASTAARASSVHPWVGAGQAGVLGVF